MLISRRMLLATGVASATALRAFPLHAEESPVRLEAGTRSIEVLGRAAKVFRLAQPDGTHGIRLPAGSMFDVDLVNAAGEDVLIHWHGLTPPVAMDGVPFVSQEPLKPGSRHRYRFPVGEPGTHWMHAHHGLQEQLLMAAPLIVTDRTGSGADVQDVVVMLHDFSFRAPEEILAELRGGSGAHGAVATNPPAAQQHGAGAPHGSGGAHGNAAMAAHGDAGDVTYDAYLANDRTLADPQIVRTSRGQRVLLRLIGAGTATSFIVDLAAAGGGELVALDGQPVRPLRVRSLGLTGGQRADILVTATDAATPVFFQAEGRRERTGIVLAPAGARIQRFADIAERPAAALDLALEKLVVPVQGLAPKPAERKLHLTLGEQPGYAWSLDWSGDRGVAASLRRGERVEVTMTNPTTMAHPMHLHGHRFQVVAIGGERRAGAMRDTVLVPAQGSVTIAFDADNPGEWPLHCHQLYHMAAGMMTTLRYAG